MTDLGLVQQVAIALTPFLPYLMNSTVTAGKDAAIKAMGEKFGEAGWNKAVGIWKKIWPAAEKKPEVTQALQDIAENADDPTASTVLQWQLKKVLVDMQPEAIEEIRSIIAESASEIRSIQASSSSVAIGGDASRNIIVAGDYSPHTIEQQQIDNIDLSILHAIDGLRISLPTADNILAHVNLDPAELGARLGVMHSKGLIKAEWASHMPGVSLPNGIYAAGLTDHGKLELINRSRKLKG